MKLIEAVLGEVCRNVEARLQAVPYLQDVELNVVLLPNFTSIGLAPHNPTGYSLTSHEIWINGSVFPSCSLEKRIFALAHEVGHHSFNVGLAPTNSGFGSISPRARCFVADWLATRWGFGAEMKGQRTEDLGEEYCKQLLALENETEFLEWIRNWKPPRKKKKPQSNFLRKIY